MTDESPETPKHLCLLSEIWAELMSEFPMAVQVSAIRFMLLIAMDQTEQTGIDSALSKALESFDAALTSEKIKHALELDPIRRQALKDMHERYAAAEREAAQKKEP